MRGFIFAAVIAATVTVAVGASGAIDSLVRSMDGSGNNAAHPTWGQAGTTGAPVNYVRVGPVNYANGIERPQPGPDFRFISNRIFNDAAPAQTGFSGQQGQNVFSEQNESQWGWTWGQFIDHDIGLRDETPGDGPALPWNANDPLETFTNDFGAIDFSRTQPSPGTGFGGVPRAHINTLSAYIDGSGVYGVGSGNGSRQEWLRDGRFDFNLSNNLATLLMLHTTPRDSRGDYLPYRSSQDPTGTRGNAGNAPPMDLMGALAGNPGGAAVAGDVRANENIALTSVHTMFAREHNRIVASLPNLLSQEAKFQIARRVIGAEIENITYSEFLPSLGVQLPSYRGYDPNVNAELSEEFAVVGYRAHSMVHGEFEPTVPASHYSATQISQLKQNGVVIEDNGDGTITLVIPLVAAFGNPSLLQLVGEDQVLENLGEHQYKNDEMFDNSMRSTLFQVPKPGVDPTTCGTPVINPSCFTGVSDLGAIDIARQRDHGIAYYNQLRQAYGLPPKTTFTAITGESTDQLPARMTINNPHILDFTKLEDINHLNIPLDSPDAQEDATFAVRRSTLASRLKAIYGDVNKVDAFVGMEAEPHVQGSEFGELQLAIWKTQFAALRDGDRFFYLTDQGPLNIIRALFCPQNAPVGSCPADYRKTLAQVIRANTGAAVPDNVFRAS